MRLLPGVTVEQVDIKGSAGDVYLRRWNLTTPWGTIKLHHFLRGDEDTDLHDHPWGFVSFILWGGYWEWTSTKCRMHPSRDTHQFTKRVGYRRSYGTLIIPICQWCGCTRAASYERRWYGPGSLLRRKAEHAHRVELPDGKTCWTVLVTSGKQRPWGFHSACGWQHWKTYWENKRRIGPGACA